MRKKPGDHEKIKQPKDEHWDFHVAGAKFETRLAKIQRAVGATEAAKKSEEVAEAHRRELKGWS